MTTNQKRKRGKMGCTSISCRRGGGRNSFDPSFKKKGCRPKRSSEREVNLQNGGKGKISYFCRGGKKGRIACLIWRERRKKGTYS